MIEIAKQNFIKCIHMGSCVFDKNTIALFQLSYECLKILFGDKSSFVFFVHGSAVHCFILGGDIL